MATQSSFINRTDVEYEITRKLNKLDEKDLLIISEILTLLAQKRHNFQQITRELRFFSNKLRSLIKR